MNIVLVVLVVVSVLMLGQSTYAVSTVVSSVFIEIVF